MTDHLEAWDRKIDDFILRGGQRSNDPEMCIIALNMLPADTPAFLVQALRGTRTTRTLRCCLTS